MKNLPALIIAALAASPLFAADPKSEPKSMTASAVTNVSPDEAEKLLNKPNSKVVVLDVRTPEEFAQGHIAGAQNVDFMESDFAKKIGALDKSQPYLLHCASGGRSTQALPVLEAQKFTTIYHLNSGFKGWEKAGKPVAR